MKEGEGEGTEKGGEVGKKRKGRGGRLEREEEKDRVEGAWEIEEGRWEEE